MLKEHNYGIASCFNTILSSPSIVPRPLNILGTLKTTLCLTESTMLIREINCSAVIAGCPMRAFRPLQYYLSVQEFPSELFTYLQSILAMTNEGFCGWL